jgi:hypothetical protein
LDPHTPSGTRAMFVGASEDGTDVYFRTPQTLTWEDGDQRMSVYDARVGGGSPAPPAAPLPCSPSQEGSCQASSGSSGASPSTATQNFVGPENPKQHKKKQHKKKQHKKKQHKKKQHKKKQHKKTERVTTSNRGAGK